MADISTIKEKIDAELDTLKTNGDIGSYQNLEFSKLTIDLDVGTYPHVILRPPAVESEQIDNVTVLRTYQFELDVIFKMENLQDNDIENTLEAMMNHFDVRSDDLEGDADGGISPAHTAPEIISDANDTNYAMATLMLDVRATQTLNYTN